MAKQLPEKVLIKIGGVTMDFTASKGLIITIVAMVLVFLIAVLLVVKLLQ